MSEKSKLDDHDRPASEAPAGEASLQQDQGSQAPRDEAGPSSDDERLSSDDGEQAESDAQDGDAQDGEANHPLYIVGIGASAGGLEALGELVKHLPFDSMAFVVVQHLSPQHDSVLTHLLSRTSKVEVVTAADGMQIVPNHVYVIPPNADLAVMHGVLHLIAPSKNYGRRLAIDFFFRSLADDRAHLAIGVVLSGTGTDGTLGLKAIKAAGGLTFVQDPATAKYEGMPRSALASGNADFCLSLEGIGQELTRLSRRPRAPAMAKRLAPAPEVQEQLAKLFVLIRSEFGNDLTYYKPATVERRIERRMMLHKITQLRDYAKFVQSSPEELRALYADMLITVTSFFRDPETFDIVKNQVLPRLLQERAAHVPLRFWVPACATGEEAYSLAICVLELLSGRQQSTKVQIFATDIDKDAIQHARRGVYAQNISSDVAPERLSRFFIKKGDELIVSRQVRDMVVFSEQNLLKDAPFSRIDLVSCRNLLIYLKPAAQKKVLRIMHYALNPQGYLLLGSSETVSDAPGLFAVLDRRNKLYTKKNVPAAALEVGINVPGAQEGAAPAGARPPLSIQALADRKVLDHYGPPGVVINEHLEILHFRGRTGPYLDPAPGAASFNLLRVARPELHMELKRAIHEALAKQLRVTVDAALREDGKSSGAVRLDVIPIQEPEAKARCLLVLFQKMPAPKEVRVIVPGPGAPAEALAPLAERIQELEQELTLTKEYLQTTIDEKESANEELKSANEELQSSNEELQSTNEELETSKEEMQSTNEELITVNEELQNRMDELGVANDDLHNFLVGVDNAVVIVGLDLRIRRYTRAAEKLLNMVAGDIGRSVSFFDAFLGRSELAAKVSNVIATLAPLEQEVLASNQRYYMLRVTPYKTLDHSIRGAVIGLIDIDLWKRSSELTRDVAGYADNFLGAIDHPLLIVDGRLRIVWANEPFYEAFKVTAEEAVGTHLLNIGSRQWLDGKLRGLLEATAATGKPLRRFKIHHPTPDKGEETILVGAGRIPMLSDATLVLISIERHVEPRGQKQ